MFLFHFVLTSTGFSSIIENSLTGFPNCYQFSPIRNHYFDPWIAVAKLDQHPNVKLITENVTNSERFHFLGTVHESILKENVNLNSKLLNTFLLIIPRMYQMHTAVLACIWNVEILHWTTFRKFQIRGCYTYFAEYYKLVSILTTVFKIFEWIMQKQITDYIEKHLAPFSCGYWKAFGKRYALLLIIERSKLFLDKQGKVIILDNPDSLNLYWIYQKPLIQ